MSEQFVEVTIDGLILEIQRLRKGIQNYLDSGCGVVFPTKHDQCPHKKFGWEECGQCTEEYFSRLLGETYTVSPSHNHTPNNEESIK